MIENFRLNIEYFRNAIDFSRKDRAKRYQKSSILNRQYSIPACPGWALKGFNRYAGQRLCCSVFLAFTPTMQAEDKSQSYEGLKIKEGGI
jgi:hypothetical protein